MIGCLLPYINHRLITEIGNSTGVSSHCTDISTDSFEAVRVIHRENGLIRTLNVNYHERSQIDALNHYVERVDGVTALLEAFTGHSSFVVSISAPPRVPTQGGTHRKLGT